MELPRLQPLYERYRDRGFEIVAVDRQADTDRATAFIEEKELTYTFLENGEDDAEVVQSTFMVRYFPTTFLVDRDGMIRFLHVGFEEGDEDRLAEEIESLL